MINKGHDENVTIQFETGFANELKWYLDRILEIHHGSTFCLSFSYRENAPFFFLYEGTFLSSFQSKMRYLCLKVNCHSIPWFLMCPPSHQFLCDGWQLVAGRTLKARERVNKQGQGRNYHFHSPKTDNIFNFCYQTLFISNFTL